MEVIEAIHTRRAVRSYLPTPVAPELIEQVIWDAAQAPPPVSGQTPWTFVVVEGLERIVAFGDEAKRYARDNHPDGPGWGWAERPDFKVFWDAPTLIIICGRSEDCARAGTNLMLSAHARGLGTCWVGAAMLWLATAKARSDLGIPPGREPAAVLCLGYPAATPTAQARARPEIIWSN